MVERIDAVEEAPFWLEVNGRRTNSWSCTPDLLTALAAGWLLAEGYHEIGRAPPPMEVVSDDGSVGIRAQLPAECALQGDLERRHRREHGCGLDYFIRCAPERIRGRSGGFGLPNRGEIAPHFSALMALARSNGIGGMHAAGLVDGADLVFPVAEVSRHNAVDKVIGQALLEGRELEGLGLILTARISGEIALKAARAGLGWIASRSVPTTLAVQIADHARLPLMARALSRGAVRGRIDAVTGDQPA